MSLQIATQKCRQLLFLVACFYATYVGATKNSTIADLWPDMKDIPDEPKKPGISYAAGGLFFPFCCQLALNESVQMEDGQLSFVSGQNFLHGDPRVFEKFPNPCTWPTYTGYEASKRQGTITYSWCSERCPGWQRIELNEVNSWVQQMLAYTLPAAIFSTNIPRRRQIRIPSQYFPRLNFWSFVSLVYKLPIATVLAAVDVVLWLIVVFCLSGPMMLSGLYESLLDHKVIRQLTAKNNSSKMTFKQRCHLAMVLPLGNIDQHRAWAASVSVVERLPELEGSATNADRQIGEKIRMLLQTQQGFGTVIGIGVLFFISSFIYACLELQDKLGGSIFSHNLAFGIFWMVVPHVAIIANMPLTSSDLTSWDLLTFEHVQKYQNLDNQLPRSANLWIRALRHLGICSKDASKSAYRAAWQWDQGRCKMSWMEQYIAEYPGLGHELHRHFRISHSELTCYVWLPALVLLLVPCALGSLISLTTPLVGLGCKSILPLMYIGAQLCLMTLWQLGVSLTSHYSKGPSWLGRLLRVLYALSAFAAGLTSVGGTIAVDIGLTNNCLCLIPISQWMNRSDPSVVTFLASNVDEGNYYASHFWLQCGVAAAALLFATTYYGWWWSRYLWTQFYAVCNNICETALIVEDPADDSPNS